MSKQSEIQIAYNNLMGAMEGMAKDAKGWKVSDMSAVRNMTTAIRNLKSKNYELQKELDDLKASIPKIKADAVRGSKGQCESEWCSDIGDFVIFGESIDEYANQLEQGDTE